MNEFFYFVFFLNIECKDLPIILPFFFFFAVVQDVFPEILKKYVKFFQLFTDRPYTCAWPALKNRICKSERGFYINHKADTRGYTLNNTHITSKHKGTNLYTNFTTQKGGRGFTSSNADTWSGK